MQPNATRHLPAHNGVGKGPLLRARQRPAPGAALAQLVEHRIRNAGVTGSSPVSGTSTSLLCRPRVSLWLRNAAHRKEPGGHSPGCADRFACEAHAAIVELKKVGELLRAIENYKGRPETLYALRIAPHVFLQSGELRQAKWSEIDFAEKVWRVPAERIKMKQPHAVPLSR